MERQLVEEDLLCLGPCQWNTLHVLLENSMFPLGNRRVLDNVAKIQDGGVTAPNRRSLTILHLALTQLGNLSVLSHLSSESHQRSTSLSGRRQSVPSHQEDRLVIRPLHLPGDDSCSCSDQRLKNGMDRPSEGIETHRWLLCVTLLRIC